MANVFGCNSLCTKTGRLTTAIRSCLRHKVDGNHVPAFKLGFSMKDRLKFRTRARNLSKELLEMSREKAEEKAMAEIEEVTNLQWSSPLQILKYPDPRLRAPNAKIAVFDDKIKKLAAEMFEIMYQDDGVGLAAPQVGVNVRMMVFNPEGVRGQGKEMILVNPRVLSKSKSTDIGEEGCLSFPGIHGDVERSLQLKVRAQDETGRAFTINISGWTARIFQHEYDHLQGTLFHDRMLPTILEAVMPALLKMEETFMQDNPQTPIQRVKTTPEWLDT